MLRHLSLLYFLVLMALAVAGCARKPAPRPPGEIRLPQVRTGETETGLASWYGDPYHGRQAASGETYDKMKFTAAHRTLPFHTWVRVTNLENNRFTTVRINDRGPFIEGRIIDLSQAAAMAVDMIGQGTALVRLDIIQRPPAGASARSRFAVQVGAFLVRENAERLRQSLANTYGDVFIESHNAPDGRYYRVRVGARTEEEAFRLAARLKRDGGVSETFVVRVD